MVRKRLGSVALAFGLWFGSASSGLAADSVTVTAEVSILAPCLTSSTPSIDFGPMLFSSNAGLEQRYRPISYVNCGGSEEQIFGRATNASEVGGTGAWMINGSNVDCPDLGLNQYRLVTRSTVTGRATTLISVDQGLEYLGSGASGEIDQLLLTAPCSGSEGSGSTMSFQVIFTATF